MGVPHAHGDRIDPTTIDPLDIDRLDDAELDELPYGVICIDREGTILRYNLAEARMARLDRNSVIGLDFFREIAPCTATPQFEGRVRELMRGEVEGPIVRFDYVFDFKFGAQQVDIEAVASVDRTRYYMIVNRRRFMPVRDDAREPAPRQSELVTREDAGAVRDTREQRIIRAPQLVFEALLRTCDKIAPGTWELFCSEWGVQWGRRAVVDMEMRCLEATGESLAERPMEEVAQRIADEVSDQGWGSVTFDFERAPLGLVHVRLDNSTLASASRTQTRRCHLVAGMIGATLSHLAGQRLHAVETRCRAQGHPWCDVVVVGKSRAESVDALASEDLDLQTLVERLNG